MRALHGARGRDHDFQYLAVRADGGSTLIHDVVKVIKGPRGVAARLRGIMIEIGARPCEAATVSATSPGLQAAEV